MTVYNFAPQTTTINVDWNNPAIWSTQTVPNASDADVVLSQITQTGAPYPLSYEISISSGETIAIRSLTLPANELFVAGSLSISNSLVVTYPGFSLSGTLSAGSIEVSSAGQIDANGPIVCAGALTNQGVIDSDVVNGVSNPVSISCGSIQNSGTLAASNGEMVTVSVTQPGGFTNFSGTTLTGGTYAVGAASTLDLQLGGSVATLAATIEFIGAGGLIAAFDPGAADYVSVASSLTKIAAAGSLTLVGGAFTTANTIEDAGMLSLTDKATFSAATLHIDPGGQVTAGTNNQVTNNQGNGPDNSIAATSIVNQGLIVTSSLTGTDGSSFRINATTLENDGIIAVGLNSSLVSGSSTIDQAVLQATAITGSGTIVLGSGQTVMGYYGVTPITTTYYSTLELSAAVSNDLLFSNNYGSVILDSPQSFTGVIEHFTNGDSISLAGVSLSSVTGYSFAGTASGGVLSVQEGATTIDLSFAGSFSTQSFSLSAGPQPLSSSLPSVVITDVGSSQALPYTVAEALAVSQSGVVTGTIPVTDSAADVLTSLDSLETMAAAGTLGSITVTDSGTPTISVSTTQLANDVSVLNDIASTIVISVDASPANATLVGVSNHATIAVFTGDADQYSLAAIGGGDITVTDTGRTSVDHLSSILQLQFADRTITTAASNSLTEYVALLYQGALGRTPDAAGLASWEAIANTLPAAAKALGVYALSDVSGNYNGALSIAGGFSNSAEFLAKYGSLSNAQFVTQLYANTLDRQPDTAGYNSWMTALSSGATREHVLVGFVESAEAISDATLGYTGQSGVHPAWLLLT
jgi:hypothetical protein